MSEVAGRLAAQAGAHYLERPLGGRGLLLGGVAGRRAGPGGRDRRRVVGYNAAMIALGLGANVTILDALNRPDAPPRGVLHGRVRRSCRRPLQIEESRARSDVVIGAVLIPGALAPKLVTREMIRG